MPVSLQADALPVGARLGGTADAVLARLREAYEAGQRGDRERATLQAMVQYIDPDTRTIWLDVGVPRRLAVMGWHEFDAWREVTEEQLVGWIGRLINFRVIQMYRDEVTGEEYAICSRKAFQLEAGQDFFVGYRVGDTIETRVRGIGDRRVYTELPGGVTGIIPIAELEDGYTERAEDVVERGQVLHCMILRMMPETGRAILSVRRARQMSWDEVTQSLRVGGVAAAQVVAVRPDSNRVILRLSVGALAGTTRPNHLDLAVGDWCRVRIARILPERRRIFVRLIGKMREAPGEGGDELPVQV
ncbi:hypothetical protein JCM13210_03740 [Thermaerobacter litoralis]